MCYECFFPELARLQAVSSKVVLKVWFPGLGILTPRRSLLEIQILGPHPRPTKSETQGQSNLCFN